jgi:hypothetical protein
MSEHTAELPGPAATHPAPQRRSRRGLIAVVASVVAVVLIAGGGFAAWKFFFAGGPRPAEVLPDTTFALVTLDLNPSGGQKIEAIKTLRKFPSWRERTGITPDSDVAEEIFDEAFQDGPCKALDYQDDVKPWIGSRLALGGVLLADKRPAPVLAVQVKDAGKARTGFAKLADCLGGDDDDFAWTTTDDYVIASDSLAHAKEIVSAGEKSTLAADADYQKWTDEVGGPAILNAYAGPMSAQILSDSLGSDLEELTGGGLAGGLSGVALTEDDTGSGTSGSSKVLDEALKDFTGAAAGLKFEDGGIELAFAGGGAATEGGRTVSKHVGALPKDTAAVLALAVPAKALEKLASDGSSENPFDLGRSFTEFTGLELPEDLVTLLGDSLSLSVGADAPADLTDLSDPSDLPFGVLVHGDEAKIRALIAKVEARTGATLAELPATVASRSGKVAIATRPDYAEDLLGGGTLADSKDFEDVVTHVDDAQGVFYVSLDNAWFDALKRAAGEEDDKDLDEIVDNLAVLRALGVSAWTEGKTSHGLLRVALK